MYILGFLVVLLIGAWVLPFAVHIDVKVHQVYFAMELVIKVFEKSVFQRRWQGDWLSRSIEKWKESANKQTKSDKQESEGDVRGIVPNLLRLGRWKKFIWRAEIGLDDAMVTAVVIGGIWGLQGVIWERWIRDKKCMTVINCRPNFDELMLRSEMICIVYFRLGDIIKEFTKGYLKSKRRNVI